MKLYKRSRYYYWSTSKAFSWMLPPKEKTSFTNIDDMVKHLESPDPLLGTVIDKFQDIVMFPVDFFDSVRIHIRNCKGNTHVLDGGLEKGVWYDLDYRIEQCLFNELEKYIEQEKGLEMHAWEQTLVWDDDSWIGKDDERFSFPTPQALAAQEQDVIYNWWKENKNKRTLVSFDDSAEYDNFQQQVENMLIRLIKIRKSLWT